MQYPVKGNFHAVYSCCVLIGNTTQFKPQKDSQNLCLDFVIRTIQKEDIFRNTAKINSKYCSAFTALRNAETRISETRSFWKIKRNKYC